uniref:Gamma-secretase subunit Aph-1 n=1 Tax=Globisporangium ultimum (strain ATCC 200006 / CBS 805.95 / DAOM BR144) TaxID=431595 RepID=K3X4S5_GLOUD
MTLHDGKVNWPLFFGCILTAFGPLAALFFVVVAKRAQLVIIALSGAFTWLVAILVTATLWRIIPPLKDSIEATIPVGVVIQEAFRYVFFVLYTRTERAVHKVTTSPSQFPLNDITSSLAGGLGFSLMHALMMYGSLVGSSTGSRGAAFTKSCESVPLIFAAALSTLALTLMDVALMIVAFDGYRKKSFLAIGTVFVIHLGVALSALANQKTNGCAVAIPLHFAGALVATGAAATMISRWKNAGASS